MTEQEFRDALKRQVGQTGLSSDRQYRVLAGMKGGEGKVRTWNKMKIALVLAALVVMTMGAAVATEIVKYVNWDGKPVDYEPPVYESLEADADPIRDPIADELIRNKKLEEILMIFYPGQVNIAKSESHHTSVSSLEELKQLAGEQTLLPIPDSVPEGFTLTNSSVHYTRKKGTTYQYLGEERYEAGVRAKRYTCDPDDLWMVQYFLFFRDPNGEHLNLSASLTYREEQYLKADAIEVKSLQVLEMEKAVLIDRGERKFVYARKRLQEPIACQILMLAPGGIETPETDRQYVALELQANSTICDVETMLACFGLTTQ